MNGLLVKAARIGAYAIVAIAGCVLAFYPAALFFGAVFSYTSGGLIREYPVRLQQEFSAQHLTYLPSAALPRCAIDGIVSVEDKRFFVDPGIDPVALGRVLLASLRNDHQDHGGSTITEQLSRLILHESRNQPSLWAELWSQLRIIKYALVLEHEYTKDTIITLYLNSVYFGRGAQGFAQAAHAYFGTSAQDLTQAQCYYLTGLPQAPTYFGDHPQSAATLGCYDHVLFTLRRHGYLSRAQEQSLSASAPFSSTTPAAASTTSRAP